MRVELSDEQEFLRDAVAGVVARDAAPSAVRAWAQARASDAAHALAVRQGWTGIGVDEDRGGQGGGVIELAVLAEQLGRGAVPWDRTLAAILAARLLSASDAEAATALAEIAAEGARGVAPAIDGRVPLTAASPSLRVAGGRVTGALRHVLAAGEADTLVLAVAGDEDGAVALYAVATEADGVTVTPRALVDGTRSLADVVFADAPAEALGTIPAEALVAVGRAAAVALAADALGAAEALLDMTVAYVKERQQFGVPVGSFQAVKHGAAQMLVDVEGARAAVHYGAWAVDAGSEDAGAHAAVAKAQACDAAFRVADRALFLHGAVGYTWEHDLQFAFKRIKSDRLLLGSPDAHRDLLAAELLAAA
ncbi:MAG TPA: acyl-CoA dehydrogenase family protein [Baekduia sp.]|uniref:acyl-CoA dehydrogenase family protein n=1 Tax=Baekduia sp. TaxID=2600305 RepID=UPI002D78BD12|nr:acyl-CoA dehydrogenase family protein [Baekduia sp.]HET6507897.1 acyl-CoA dehydrogenase family protein [Baekduia sp.]